MPVAAAEFCVVVCCGCGVGVGKKKSLPHTHTQPVPRLSPLSYLIMNIISPRKELASPLPVHTTQSTLHIHYTLIQAVECVRGTTDEDSTVVLARVIYTRSSIA